MTEEHGQKKQPFSIPRDSVGNRIRDPANPEHVDRFEECDLDEDDEAALDWWLECTSEAQESGEPRTDPNVEWLDSEEDDIEESDGRDGGAEGGDSRFE